MHTKQADNTYILHAYITSRVYNRIYNKLLITYKLLYTRSYTSMPPMLHARGWHLHMLCIPIFVHGQIKTQGQLKIFFIRWSTVKLLYPFDVFGKIGQGQSKILAKIIICNCKVDATKSLVKILIKDADWSTQHIGECHPLAKQAYTYIHTYIHTYIRTYIHMHTV